MIANPSYSDTTYLDGGYVRASESPHTFGKMLIQGDHFRDSWRHEPGYDY